MNKNIYLTHNFTSFNHKNNNIPYHICTKCNIIILESHFPDLYFVSLKEKRQCLDNLTCDEVIIKGIIV